jgi:hypothetical protein
MTLQICTLSGELLDAGLQRVFEVAKVVSYLNQGGSVWTFKVPDALASR